MASRAKTTKNPDSYIVCSQCQQAQPRSQYSQTQIDESLPKRRCKPCMASTEKVTKTPSRLIVCSQCQQGKPRSQYSQTQLNEATSTNKKCMQCMASTARTTNKPDRCIPCSQCHEKKRSVSFFTEADEPCLVEQKVHTVHGERDGSNQYTQRSCFMLEVSTDKIAARLFAHTVEPGRVTKKMRTMHRTECFSTD